MLLRDKVYADLRDQIVNGGLRPGALLSIPDLARELAVSRTPVREALRRLEDERLVETVASRWTRVAPLEIDAAVQLYPVRWALEAVAIRTTPAFSAASVERMEQANRALAAAVSRGDTAAAMEADGAFHSALIDPSGNDEIAAMVTLIDSRLLRFAMAYWDEGTIGEQSVAEHAGVIASLATGARESAAQSIEQHWRNSLGRMRPVHARSVALLADASETG